MSAVTDVIVIFCTVPPKESPGLVRMLVEERLAACVNTVSVRSCYRWNGEVCDEEEHLLVLKTTQDRMDELIVAIKADHPYLVPEIIALPVLAGYLPYLEWVRRETTGDA
jgi:periplasmic divalent cation tolerance protein